MQDFDNDGFIDLFLRRRRTPSTNRWGRDGGTPGGFCSTTGRERTARRLSGMAPRPCPSISAATTPPRWPRRITTATAGWTSPWPPRATTVSPRGRCCCATAGPGGTWLTVELQGTAANRDGRRGPRRGRERGALPGSRAVRGIGLPVDGQPAAAFRPRRGRFGRPGARDLAVGPRPGPGTGRCQPAPLSGRTCGGGTPAEGPLAAGPSPTPSPPAARSASTPFSCSRRMGKRASAPISAGSGALPNSRWSGSETGATASRSASPPAWRTAWHRCCSASRKQAGR